MCGNHAPKAEIATLAALAPEKLMVVTANPVDVRRAGQ